MIGRFDLSAIRDEDGITVISFDDELAVLSGSTDNVELLDQVMEEVGEDPKVWLPIFHQRRRARISSSKHQER